MDVTPNGCDTNWRELQNVSLEIFVVDDGLEAVAHEFCGDHNGVGATIGEFIQELLEQRGHDRVQPTRTNVFHALVDQRRERGANERGRRWISVMLERSIAAIDDLDLITLMDEMA